MTTLDNILPDALGGDLTAQETVLKQQGEYRSEHSLELSLQSIVNRVADRSSDIMNVLSHKSATSSLVSLMADAIVSASNDDMAVTTYHPRLGADQTVLVFDGKCWRTLDKQVYFDLVNDCCRRARLPESYLGNPNFMKPVYDMVAFRVAGDRQPSVPRDEVWINFDNGTLEIKADGTTVFRPHRREDFMTSSLPYGYDPDAACPQWHQCLDRILPDLDVQLVLAEFIGYCFTRDMKLEKMLVLFGEGSNGKSVVLDTIEAMMGSENVSNVSLSDLTTNDEKRLLMEKRFVNISHESDKELDVTTLKKLVSGEPVDVRRLYVGSYIMTDYGKLITSFNILPRAEMTHGFYRRFVIIPFKVVISEEEANIDLAKELRSELPGILNWVLEALKGLLARRKFTPSAVCREALDQYKLSSNNVRLFISEECEKETTEFTAGSELYHAYCQFCSESNLKPVGIRLFYERLERIGIHRDSGRGRTAIFRLKLTNNGRL